MHLRIARYDVRTSTSASGGLLSLSLRYTCNASCLPESVQHTERGAGHGDECGCSVMVWWCLRKETVDPFSKKEGGAMDTERRKERRKNWREIESKVGLNE